MDLNLCHTLNTSSSLSSFAKLVSVKMIHRFVGRILLAYFNGGKKSLKNNQIISAEFAGTVGVITAKMQN